MQRTRDRRTKTLRSAPDQSLRKQRQKTKVESFRIFYHLQMIQKVKSIGPIQKVIVHSIMLSDIF